jgi:predicted RNA-binding Zn ribbon-like protein
MVTYELKYGGVMDLLFVDLVNSEWYDGNGNREDRLLDWRWQAKFLARWGLQRYRPLDRRAVAELAGLRSVLRDLTERLARGARPAGRQLDALNAVLARTPLRLELRSTGDGYAVEPVPSPGGHPTEHLLAEVARSAAGFLAGGELERLKVCDNQGCRWAFYDESRNRSRRWCQSTACGNRFKVRRFRERQRGRR